MCLSLPKLILGTPEKDITVYKVFAIGRFGLRSPYYPYFWEFNKVHSTRLQKPYMDMYGNIQGCAFHSFANRVDADLERQKLERNTLYERFVVCECVIPKDSLFIYEGTYNRSDGYASEKLQIVDKNVMNAVRLSTTSFYGTSYASYGGTASTFLPT